MKTFAVSFLCSPSKLRKKTGEAPIEVSISVNGERVIYQTTLSARPEVFKKSMSSKSPNDIRKFTDTIRQRINEIQTNLLIQKIPVTAKRIKDELEGKGAKNSPLWKNVAAEVLKTKMKNIEVYHKYQTVIKRASEQWGAEKPVDEITSNDIIQYKDKWSQKLKDSTMIGEMKRLKSFFTFAQNAGYIQVHPFNGLKFQFREDSRPYLTYDEIEKIRNAKLDEYLDSVRNFFLFLCFSGLEYSDVVHLDPKGVKKNQYGQWYYKAKRIKTGVEYISIFYEDAAELWELFGGDLKIISIQKTNAYLKLIASAAGITKSLSTIVARHTYATYLLSVRLIPVDIVQRMLGHTSNKQSLHYARMLDETVFQEAYKTRYPTRTPSMEQTKEDAADMAYIKEKLGLVE